MNPKQLEEQLNKDIMKAFGLDTMTEDEKISLDAEYEAYQLEKKRVNDGIEHMGKMFDQITTEMIREQFADELKGTPVTYSREKLKL